MSIEIGMKYQIAKDIKSFYNSAETLQITRLSQDTVQFVLSDGKGHGAMPVQHMQYLLKRADLTQVSSKRALLEREQPEMDIS